MGGSRLARRDQCVITFDDGYRDVYRYAYPLLKQMGIPAIIYLPSAFIGTRRRFNHDRLFHLLRRLRSRGYWPLFDVLPAPASALVETVLSGRKTVSAALDDFIGEYPTSTLVRTIHALEERLGGGADLRPEQGEIMDWDEVRRMVRDGFDFGAHTQGHVVLTHEPLAVMEREVRESKARIERETGVPVRDFAYCNGWYSDELIRVLVRHGFRSAVTTEDLPNRIGGDPFTLKRKVLWENFSRGLLGEYSDCLTGCQMDDCFGVLGVRSPVPGRRPQHLASAAEANRVDPSGPEVSW
jgi:peptidoglycan/xylan/chitin deacetylase (PgdA/CDA1 family)